MENVKLSFIIPVYNGERTLKNCLNSILLQKWKDYEIILIDDGSTDDSLQICKAFADKNENITFITSEKSGLSFARNLGIEKAAGTWITFVNCKDEINKDSFEQIERILDVKADLIIMNAAKTRSRSNKIHNIYPFQHITKGTVLDFNPIYSQYKYTRGSVLGCLYRLESIRKYKIKFSTEIINSEDYLFFALVQYYFEKVYFTNIDFYIINKKDKDLISDWDEKELQKLPDNIDVVEVLFRKSKIDYSQVPIFNNLIYKIIIYVFKIYIENRVSRSVLKDYRKKIKALNFTPIHTQGLPFMLKLKVHLLNTSVFFFEQYMKMKFKR